MRKIAQLTGHNAAVYALAPGQGERHFLSAAGDGWVAEWDLDNPDMGRLVAKVDTQVFSICHLREEKLLVLGNMNGGVHWVDLNNDADTRNIAHHTKGVFGVCRVGKHVFTVGGGGKLTKWSIDERRSLESFHLANQSLRSVVFSEKRNELAVGASDNSIYFLDADSMALRHRIEQAHDNSVFALRYHPNGELILSGGRDAHLKVWSLNENHQLEHSIPAHMYTINDIVFHPKGHRFATASRDKTIKFWDAERFQLLKVIEGLRDDGHFHSVNRLFWAAHEETLISASDDRSLILWKEE